MRLSIQHSVNWGWFGVFMLLGILNMIQVHAIPGIFYLLLASLYCPPLAIYVRNKVGFAIPFGLKMLFALLVLWASLAVGDLAELYGL